MKRTLIYSIIFAGQLFYLAGCKSNKTAVKIPKDEVEVIVPCSGSTYFTTSEAFRANSLGESLDQVISKKKAMTNVRAQLAASIESTVKTVTDNYLNSRELNNKEEAEERFETLNREIVNQTLSGIKVICEKMTRTTEGRYKTYLAVELSATDLVSEYDAKLTNDERLKIDYDYEKFKKTFEDEMSKLGK